MFHKFKVKCTPSHPSLGYFESGFVLPCKEKKKYKKNKTFLTQRIIAIEDFLYCQVKL